MNPVEDIWALIVNYWVQLMSHTLDLLCELFKTQEHIIRTLVNSMPDRIQALIEKDGCCSHYDTNEIILFF